MAAGRPGLDDLFNDLFGINKRGLMTIWSVIVDPSRMFVAARTHDWDNDKYSSSLRLFFFLLTVITFLQFMWANPDSSFGVGISKQLQNLPPELSGLAAPEALAGILKRYVLIYPVSLFVFTTLAALCLCIWGKGLSTVVRVRLYFLAILPNLVITALLLPFHRYLDGTAASILWSISLGLTVGADFITTSRGLRGTVSGWARTWRAGLLTLVNLIVVMTAAIAGQYTMVFWSAWEMGLIGAAS